MNLTNSKQDYETLLMFYEVYNGDNFHYVIKMNVNFRFFFCAAMGSTLIDSDMDFKLFIISITSPCIEEKIIPQFASSTFQITQIEYFQTYLCSIQH